MATEKKKLEGKRRWLASKLISYLRRVQQETDAEYRKRLLSLVGNNPSARFLDCGCGNGEFTKKMAEKIRANEVYGIDYVTENYSDMEAKGIRVLQGDLNEGLPFKNESFDIILANQIIEHLSNTDKFLREIYRVSRKGGQLILSTPNMAGFHNILALLLGKQPIDADVSDEVLRLGTCNAAKKRIPSTFGPSHRRLFTIKALEELLDCHGFKVEKVNCSGFLPFPLPLARILSSIDKRHSAIITIKARKA